MPAREFRTYRTRFGLRYVEHSPCMAASPETPFSGVLVDWRRGHVCGAR